ncbi:MAG: hypothetical protein K9I69_05190 [Ignavibacteriales bacterium]|nr:hypothetical protein [Ignavibacteriales bacterium]
MGKTPIALTLPYGYHQLLFEAPSNYSWPASSDIVDVSVGEKPLIIRHFVSRHSKVVKDRSETGNVLAAIIEATGWTLVVLGLLDEVLTSNLEDEEYMFGGSSTAIIGGVAVFAGGLLWTGKETVISARPAVNVKIPIDIW